MGPSFLCSCAARQPQGEKGALLLPVEHPPRLFD